MNKWPSFIAAAALGALVLASGALGAPSRLDYGEHSGWYCGAIAGETIVRAGAAGEWSNRNEELCRLACGKERDNPVYKRGNWALFTDTGLECCCGERHFLFLGAGADYHEKYPHVSWEMRRLLGVDGQEPPTD